MGGVATLNPDEALPHPFLDFHIGVYRIDLVHRTGPLASPHTIQRPFRWPISWPDAANFN